MIDPKLYQLLVIRKALVFYMRTGMKVNKAYTPKNMMSTAAKLTGKTFKPRDYQAAIDALSELIP
jgi:hypothetical protein